MSRQSSKRGNGEGSVHRYKGRPGWRAQAFLSDGRRPTKMVPTVKAGREWIRAQHDFDARRQLLRSDPDQRFGQWLEIWLEARVRKVAPHTYANEVSLAARYLTPFASMRLGEISEGHIDDWLADIDARGKLAKPGVGTPHVLRHCYCLLSVILGDAVRHRLLERSPMERIARPKVPPARPKYLSEDDVKRVLDACLATGDPRAVAVVLMAHLGLRRNEALGLIWDDLDVDSATMTVHMQLGRLPGDTTLQRRQLKTLTSRRTLPLSSALLELLTAVRREHERLGYTTPFIITMEGTGPVDPDATTRWLTTVGASIGVAVTPHRLRHTAATLMLNHGVSLEAVGKVLGHGDLKTTAVYARVLDSSSDRAVGALAAIFDR